jgi:hypothetical protein
MLDGHDLGVALAAAAHQLADDHLSGLEIREAGLRDRLVDALGEVTSYTIQTEKHARIPEFRGVGPVDIVVWAGDGTMAGLIECKWSLDTKRDKIYEGAWDAIKLALAVRSAPTASAFLVTGARSRCWAQSETADLFSDGWINTRDFGIVHSSQKDSTAARPSGRTAKPADTATCSRRRPRPFKCA